jgi:hypothetical protein
MALLHDIMSICHGGGGKGGAFNFKNQNIVNIGYALIYFYFLIKNYLKY